MKMKWVPSVGDPKMKVPKWVRIHLRNENENAKMNTVMQEVIFILQKVISIAQKVISEMTMSLPSSPCRVRNVKCGYSRIWMAATNSFPFAKWLSAEWKWKYVFRAHLGNFILILQKVIFAMNMSLSPESHFRNENEMSAAGWAHKMTFAKWTRIHFTKWKWEREMNPTWIQTHFHCQYEMEMSLPPPPWA